MVGIVQSNLYECRKQIASIEEMKANLKNLSSQVEMVTNDKSLPEIQREIDNYKNLQVTSMRNFEDKLLMIEKTLSLTDGQEKQMSDFSVSVKKERRTQCDSSSKFDDRLCELENKCERVMMMEHKLADLEERHGVLKLQTDRVVRGRRQESNDAAVLLERFSDLKTEISNMTNRKLLSFEARLQSLDTNKKTEVSSFLFVNIVDASNCHIHSGMNIVSMPPLPLRLVVPCFVF